MKRYLWVWLALLLLTTATFLLAHAPLGRFHLATGLVIASTKAALVILFFMHLWDHPGSYRVVISTAVILLVALIGLTLSDVVTRFPLARPMQSLPAVYQPQQPSPPPIHEQR